MNEPPRQEQLLTHSLALGLRHQAKAMYGLWGQAPSEHQTRNRHKGSTTPERTSDKEEGKREVEKRSLYPATGSAISVCIRCKMPGHCSKGWWGFRGQVVATGIQPAQRTAYFTGFQPGEQLRR